MKAWGVVPTPHDATNAERLKALASYLDRLIRAHAPHAVAVERLFFNKNARTAMAVAEARGVALLCAARAGVPVFEYTPHQVKLAVTGYGKADKKQVQEMLRVLLRLERPIRQDDAADAVAVALCHAQGATVRDLVEATAARGKSPAARLLGPVGVAGPTARRSRSPARRAIERHGPVA